MSMAQMNHLIYMLNAHCSCMNVTHERTSYFTELGNRVWLSLFEFIFFRLTGELEIIGGVRVY